jgi:hypothetical protein
MLGCLKAYARTTFTRRFYDLGRVQQKGLHTQVDLGFDESRVLNKEDLVDLRESHPEMFADVSFGERKSGYRREHNEHDYDEKTDNRQAVAVGDTSELSEDEQEVLKSERDTKTIKSC